MRQTVIAVIIIAILGAAGWFWYTSLRPGSVAPPSPLESDLVKQYEQLRTLALDTEVFSDPLFKALKHFGPATSTPVAVGRANPFAPF